MTTDQYRYTATLITTWQGFHRIRKQRGLCIGCCYVLLCFLLAEGSKIKTTQGYCRRKLVMHNAYRINLYFSILIRENYINSAGQSGNIKYFSLTSTGRSLAVDLLNACDMARVAWFNKHPLPA